jgi:prepilin peptidase CpaA
MGLGIVIHAWVGGLDAALGGLTGLVVGMGLFLLPYSCKAIGAGDVKLMAAIGSMVGPSGALSIALLSVLAGGVYALGAMTYQWGLAGTSKKLAFSAYGAFVTAGMAWSGDIQLPFKLRYGLAIAAGTILFLGGVQPFGG